MNFLLIFFLIFFQEQSELLFLDQRSVLFRCESGSGAEATGRVRSIPLFEPDCNQSSAESFASAQDEVHT